MASGSEVPLSPKGDAFLERPFFLEGEVLAEPVAIFRLWPPYEVPGQYPTCRFQVITKDWAEDKTVDGVDALDSMITALAVAGSTIRGLNESVFGGRLRWEASPEGGPGLGLPTIEDSWPFSDLYKAALGLH